MTPDHRGGVPAASQPILGEITRHPLIGHCPAFFETLAIQPDLLLAAWEAYQRTLEQGTLHPLTKAFMGLVMAEGMGAPDFRGLQVTVLGRLGRPADQVELQLRRLTPDLPDSRGGLLMELARAGTRPSEPERLADLGRRLQMEGASDPELAEAAFTIGAFHEIGTFACAMKALRDAGPVPA